MAQTIKVGIIGAGWPGTKHAEGYRAAGGFTVAGVADLIPSRRSTLAKQYGAVEHADVEALLKDDSIAAVSICLPNDLHLPIAQKAFKAGKHVICETPPARDAKETQKLTAAAMKASKVLLFAAQRRFGAAELAAIQAIDKTYAGDPQHARVSWMRTRGIPAGAENWYTRRERSGGGAMVDTGYQMLDLGWRLLGKPAPKTVYAISKTSSEVEDAAFAIIRFDNNKSLELATSWAINQAPHHQGTVCRIAGDKGAIDVYTPKGPLLYRNFGPKGEAKETVLKTPKVSLYPAMMRHFRQCIQTGAEPSPGGPEAVVLMQIVDAIYKSAASGKSVDVKS